MASFAEITEARLKLKDPAGPIQFAEVANFAAIPSTPVFQTGYRATDTGYYYVALDSPPVTLIDEPVALAVSDDRLSEMIDTYGVDEAVCKAIYDVMASIGQQLTVAKDSTGVESVEYTALKDQMAYLRDLRRQCKEQNAESSGSNTGRYATTTAVEIAGGDL